MDKETEKIVHDFVVTELGPMLRKEQDKIVSHITGEFDKIMNEISRVTIKKVEDVVLYNFALGASYSAVRKTPA